VLVPFLASAKDALEQTVVTGGRLCCPAANRDKLSLLLSQPTDGMSADLEGLQLSTLSTQPHGAGKHESRDEKT
jgi:hypothetical protein